MEQLGLEIFTLPEAISMTTQPTLQISAALPCPSWSFLVITSGAMYAEIHKLHLGQAKKCASGYRLEHFRYGRHTYIF